MSLNSLYILLEIQSSERDNLFGEFLVALFLLHNWLLPNHFFCKSECKLKNYNFYYEFLKILNSWYLESIYLDESNKISDEYVFFIGRWKIVVKVWH